MRKSVSIDEIIKKTGARELVKGSSSCVNWVVASGLMSDVLTTEKEEILLVTSLATPQVVRTADMVGANAVMIACGKPITSDITDLAKKLNITLLLCEKPVFESCCDLKELFYD